MQRRRYTQRAFHAEDKEATSGLGDAGSQEEFQGGGWVGHGLEGRIGFVAESWG